MSRRSKNAIKDRILNARIPEDLDRELREQAERLDMPVSQLVRGILQRTVDLVGNLSGNVEHLVSEVVEDVAGFRETVEAAAGGGRAAVLRQIIGWQPIRCARTTRCWATGRDLQPGDNAWVGVRDDGRPGPFVAEHALEGLLAGWKIEEQFSQVRLNREVQCHDTGDTLPIGAMAWIEKGHRPPRIISDAAFAARREAAESPAPEEDRDEA